MSSEKPKTEPEGKDLEILNYLNEGKTYAFIADKVQVSRTRIIRVKNEYLSDSIDSTTDNSTNSTTKKKQQFKKRIPDIKSFLIGNKVTDPVLGSTNNSTVNNTIDEIPLKEIKLLIRSAKSKWSYGKGKYPNMEVIIDNVVNWTEKVEQNAPIKIRKRGAL